MSINWPVVLVRLVDGALYGTGFILAVFFWRWLIGVGK
jgi:hypothetical protein